MTSCLTVKIQLSDSYKDSLSAIVKDEIAEASRKWKTGLTEEEKTLIEEKSFEQLVYKMKFCYSCDWQVEDEITIDFPGGSENVTVPSKEAEDSQVRFIRSNSGWQIDGERGEDSIKLNDLQKFLKDDIETWLRTAVFYGVGSFKE